MSGYEVPGSKPRKFVTRTILTNPSLISVSVTSLLDPENQSLPKIYHALEKKQLAVAHNESRMLSDFSPAKFAREASLQQKSQRKDRASSNRLDSLQEAEKEFLSKKTSMGSLEGKGRVEQSQRSHLLLKKQLGKQLSFMSRGSSTPSLLNSFHYKNSGEIKLKQAKGYNIISNLA